MGVSKQYPALHNPTFSLLFIMRFGPFGSLEIVFPGLDDRPDDATESLSPDSISYQCRMKQTGMFLHLVLPKGNLSMIKWREPVCSTPGTFSMYEVK